MITEKTLGKVELLEGYVSENYPKDNVINTILNSIVRDMKAEEKVIRLQPKKEVVEKQKTYPERIDLTKMDKKKFQSLVNKNLETKTWKNSTVINKATYDKSKKVLTIYEKHNIIHEFRDVPNSVKESLFKNGKPGKYYHSFIQGKYKSRDLSLIG